jgi:pimeloyl-ACP methyl ester carboxylesterase
MNFDAVVDNCQVFGNRLVFHRSGEGEVVLLVHGITSYSFIWKDVFQSLSHNYDVIAVDLLGCGNSDMPLDVSYSLNSHADILKEFVNILNIEKFHYVGHDLGGGIGQIFAINNPGLLYDLTLINTVGYDFWPVQPITAMRAPVIRELLMSTFDLGLFMILIKRGLYHKEKLTQELMDAFSKPLQSNEGKKAFMHFARCLDNKNLMDIVDQLRQLEIPVLVIRSDGDVYLRAAIAEQLHKDIPGSRLVRIDKGGHFVQVDEPDWVAAEINNFIRECYANRQ